MEQPGSTCAVWTRFWMDRKSRSGASGQTHYCSSAFNHTALLALTHKCQGESPSQRAGHWEDWWHSGEPLTWMPTWSYQSLWLMILPGGASDRAKQLLRRDSPWGFKCVIPLTWLTCASTWGNSYELATGLLLKPSTWRTGALWHFCFYFGTSQLRTQWLAKEKIPTYLSHQK